MLNKPKNYCNLTELYIFNNNDTLMYISDRNFKTFLQLNNLPLALNTSANKLLRLSGIHTSKFKDWFAIRIPKELKYYSKEDKLKYCLSLIDKINKNTLDKNILKKINLNKSIKFPIIKVYNNLNQLIFNCENQSFKDFCKLNNLPFETFVKSYLSKTRIEYNLNNKTVLKRLTNNGNIKYNGWYAIQFK